MRRNRLQVTGDRLQERTGNSLSPATCNLQPGFTLIEMIVAVALFAVVMVVAVGALLSLTGANKKAQAIQSVMNNLNITLDGMVRNIRMGTEFHCGIGPYSGSSGDSCSSGQSSFTFTCNPGTATCGGSDVRWAYRLVCPIGLNADNTCPSGGYIQRSQDGGTTWPATGRLTAEEVSVENLTFYVVGTQKGADMQQPKVVMVVTGTAGGQNVKTKTTFHIQATAVQRELDL